MTRKKSFKQQLKDASIRGEDIITELLGNAVQAAMVKRVPPEQLREMTEVWLKRHEEWFRDDLQREIRITENRISLLEYKLRQITPKDPELIELKINAIDLLKNAKEALVSAERDKFYPALETANAELEQAKSLYINVLSYVRLIG